MNSLTHKNLNQYRRANRVRTLLARSDRPRLSVHISNTHIMAQIIDDSKSHTVAYVTTVGQKIDGNMTDKAVWVGKEISAKAKKAKVSKIVFDRGGKQYHGRVKALADAARAGGLEF
jgi:large subunit ribosomal protein L18